MKARAPTHLSIGHVSFVFSMIGFDSKTEVHPKKNLPVNLEFLNIFWYSGLSKG